MKKIIALLMAGMMTASVFAGCGAAETGSSGSSTDSSGSTDSSSETSDTADWDYIKNKGKMTIGITYFEPMNYKDDNGELTGFETEFATAVCAELGVTPEFQEINWDSRELELNANTIDCIWNGMTITDERKENMDISVPYMENKQVMVCRAEDVEKYSTADGLDGANVVAEAGSAGEDVAKGNEYFSKAKYASVSAQSTALFEVKSGTSDIAVIDYVMSIGTLAEGTDFSDLKVVEAQSFEPEQYGIAFRKNSPETLKNVNAAIQKLADNGKLKEIADKYNLGDLILVKPAA